MKNKIAIASAFLAASSFSFAEIAITENLSFEGFIDMSYTSSSGEILGLDESDSTFQIDQVEISWLFDFDPVTGQIDLEYEEASDQGDDLEVEQAFASYHMDNGSAITAGRYASMLGFEAFEPTGLYQFSTAYLTPNTLGQAAVGAGLGEVSAPVIDPLPLYNQGVKYTYESDDAFFGVSVQDGLYNYGNRIGGDNGRDGSATDGGGFGVEAAGAFTPGEGWTLFLGAGYEEGDGGISGFETSDDTEMYVVNVYTTYETGAWVFAAELVYAEQEIDEGPATLLDAEITNGLIMANYAYSEAASVTGRLSYMLTEDDSASVEADQMKATIAHNYAFTDNLLLVTEISWIDGEFDEGSPVDGEDEWEELQGAVELLFTF